VKLSPRPLRMLALAGATVAVPVAFALPAHAAGLPPGPNAEIDSPPGPSVAGAGTEVPPGPGVAAAEVPPGPGVAAAEVPPGPGVSGADLPPGPLRPG
jgi:hypothetical protein